MEAREAAAGAPRRPREARRALSRPCARARVSVGVMCARCTGCVCMPRKRACSTKTILVYNPSARHQFYFFVRSFFSPPFHRRRHPPATAARISTSRVYRCKSMQIPSPSRALPAYTHSNSHRFKKHQSTTRRRVGAQGCERRHRGGGLRPARPRWGGWRTLPPSDP